MTMSFFSTQKQLGILGGGQLGKMLLYTTRKWDIPTQVLDPSIDAPARLACNHFEQGSLMDYDTVLAFGEKVSVLTIEIENVNVAALETLEVSGVQVYPQPKILKIIQNKCLQKEFYKTQALPTAPYSIFNSKEALKEAVARGSVSFPFVWKAAAMGYDGFGVKVIRSNNDLENIGEGQCLAEDLVSIALEMAVIVCRNPQGESATYPVVEMEFHSTANQVEYVLSPARISSKLEEKARKLAEKVSESFQHVGLLAVELFLTDEGELLVNEVAPRPHNSGHTTIETAYTSQFEQHIRAILGLPLGRTDNKACGVMVNLVGQAGHQGPVHYQNIEHVLAMEGVTPHIYGKKETRPFRKMGHVTVVHEDLNTARRMAEEVKETLLVISK